MKRKTWIAFCLIVFVILLACNGTTPQPVTPTPSEVKPTPLPEAVVAFRVTIPAPPNPGEAVLLAILDEVTGLALNPQTYVMQADDATHYSVILPLPFGSVVKYRYMRQGSSAVQEHLSDGRSVRYRLFHVEGPALVQDVVGRWTDTTFSGSTGRISGQVADSQNGQPLANILVTAGGAQSLTTADGSYLLEGLPPGTHNLVAFALDGSYRTFQQGAVVAPDSTTPAPLHLVIAPRVDVIFSVTVPEDTPPEAVIRLGGSLLQLGNTYADLVGGVSSLASRMPTLVRLPDGRFSTTLNLPAGADIKYKYTLGDGLWSAEHRSDGSFRLRELIVPENSTNIEDRVETWNSGNSAPIGFEVTAPAYTPAGETLSIQFNPGYGWTEPIPMWSLGNNRWKFVLTSPMDMMGTIGYRYCRQEQCGSADDIRTMGDSSAGRPVSTSLFFETMLDNIEAWVWLEPLSPATVPNVSVTPRGPDFIAGVEFQPDYHPSWGAIWNNSINDVKAMQANWIFMAPTWTFTRNAPPILEPAFGNDALWPEEVQAILTGINAGVNIALFPTPHFPMDPNAWWQSAPRDFSWWVVWFEQYRKFLIHHAELADKTGAQILVLGGEWLNPALPGGLLADGNSSNVPLDAEGRWLAIIEEIRLTFHGKIYWALNYPQGIRNPPSFLDKLDGVYLLWSAPLAQSVGATNLYLEAGRLLDTDIQPFRARLNKPIILGIAYASAHGSYTSCINLPDGSCVSLEDLARPNPDIPSVTINLQEQADAYNALMFAVNERSWISGVVSRGFYPPVPLQDKSASVHGKLAGGVLWYWYPRFTAK